MDRHRCIVVPPYRSQLTPARATALTLVTWLLAAVLFLPIAFWFREEPELGICTLVFPRSDYVNMSICFTIPALFFTCLLPMSLLVFHYQRIFHKIIKRSRWPVSATTTTGVDITRRTSEQVSRKISLQQIVSPVRSSSLSNHDQLRLTKHLRVLRVLLLNVLVVLVMWLPITIVMFLIYLDGSRPTEDTAFFLHSHHFIWALLFALLNTIFNPLLYGFLSENFRVCFARLWFGSRRKRAVSKDFLNEGISKGAQTHTPSLTRQQPTHINAASVVDVPTNSVFR